jgi:hypothetical protein
MSNDEVITCRALDFRSDMPPFELFGKRFRLDAVSAVGRVVIHDDYPFIDQSDVRDFATFATKRQRLTVSGCIAFVHPYRLMYTNHQGFDSFVVDVPQEIRGDRHRYPPVYQSIPALLFAPPNVCLQEIEKNQLPVEIYVLPKHKLLDRTIVLESLMIRNFQKKNVSIQENEK